jgi:hypothetical protein
LACERALIHYTRLLARRPQGIDDIFDFCTTSNDGEIFIIRDPNVVHLAHRYLNAMTHIA